MNHLEQLVSEWLQYNQYFVRTSVQVGPRDRGGFEGELDVVGINLAKSHLLHIECSLDANSAEKREQIFAAKFERGRRFIKSVFPGATIPDEPEQIVVLQFPTKNVRIVGGAKLVTVRDLINEILEGLRGKPSSGAVPSNLPLIRTLQLAADTAKGPPTGIRIIQ